MEDNFKSESGHYFHLSNWQTDVLKYSCVEGKEKLSLGFYDIYSNKAGVVRDHMYGRRSGLKNGVFPEILKHPANCKIITHSENATKGNSINDASIELHELFDRIRNFTESYCDHALCLKKIEEYEMGERYVSRSKQSFL